MSSVTDRPVRSKRPTRQRVSDPWDLHVDRGPDWLFLKLPASAGNESNVADRLWSVLTRHFTYRLVLEMDDLDLLPSQLIGQLIMLQKRVMQRDGALRLCKMSDGCQEALHLCRLDRALPNYASREDAVHGLTQPSAPR